MKDIKIRVGKNWNFEIFTRPFFFVGFIQFEGFGKQRGLIKHYYKNRG